MTDLAPLTPATLPFGRYRHYKGEYYEVRGVARHSETREWVVFYRCLYGDFSDWVRPFAMFTETIEHQGKEQPRFSYVGADDTVLEQG